MTEHPIHHNDYIPWRDRAFLSLAEAAQIVGRSEHWIRRRLSEGRIEGVRLLRGGPIAIRAGSLANYVDSIETIEPVAVQPPALRLVVNNR